MSCRTSELDHGMQSLEQANYFFCIQIPEEEKNFGPHERLIHVYHFITETAQNQLVRLHTYAEIISLSYDDISGTLFAIR